MFAIGIAVDWISFHSEEREVLLINQHIPIQSIKSFEFLLENVVIHLLHSVISYTKHIVDPLRFYRVMGIAGQFDRSVPYDSEWVAVIEERQKETQILLQRTEMGNTLWDRLVNELKMPIMLATDAYSVFSRKFAVTTHRAFNCFTLTKEARAPLAIQRCPVDCKLVDDRGQESIIGFDENVYRSAAELCDRSFEIQVRSKKLFGTDTFFHFQTIDQSQLQECSDIFAKALYVSQQDHNILLRATAELEQYESEILQSEFILNAKHASSNECDTFEFNFALRQLKMCVSNCRLETTMNSS